MDDSRHPRYLRRNNGADIMLPYRPSSDSCLDRIFVDDSVIYYEDMKSTSSSVGNMT